MDHIISDPSNELLRLSFPVKVGEKEFKYLRVADVTVYTLQRLQFFLGYIYIIYYSLISRGPYTMFCIEVSSTLLKSSPVIRV